MLLTIIVAPSVLAVGIVFFLQNWAEMRGVSSDL
jgi:hypothetical protein